MTGRKPDPDVIERIFVLKVRDQLPHALIARRLGLSIDTIQKYVTQFRHEGRLGGDVLQKVR